MSYVWDGETLLICNPADSLTSRNLIATGKVRLGLGTTRDVVLIEGTATRMRIAEVSDTVADAYAQHTGWDPRAETREYTWFCVRPIRVQAWREVDELDGRTIMRSGNWLTP